MKLKSTAVSAITSVERKIVAPAIGYANSTTFVEPTTFSWPCKCGWEFKGKDLFAAGLHDLPCKKCGKTLQIEIITVEVTHPLISEGYMDKMNRDYRAHNALIESQNDHMV